MDVVWRDDVDLLHTQNGKEAARNREGWRKEIAEATAQRQAESPYKKKLNQTEKRLICTIRKRFFPSPKRPDRLHSAPSLLYNWYREFFPGGKSKAVGASG
jgi:hypothetical protein